MSVEVTQIGRCAPGNECRLTVENSTKIQGIEDDIKELKTDVKGMRNEIKSLVYGIAGATIVLLLNWLWPLIKN